jgi:3-isopropylmalate/(R)-2-methylmalate dehydratase small subunit
VASFQSITSTLAPLTAQDVDTDQIIPARFLKVTSRDGLGSALFADWRYDSNGEPRRDFVLNDPAYAGAQILLAGANFGCGSSREHAPWALVGFGFRAIIAPSFADIFRNNALKNGLLPVALPAAVCEDLVSRVARDPRLRATVDLEAQEVRVEGEGRGHAFAVDPFARRCLLDGVDEMGYLLSHAREIDAFERARTEAPC